jgi:hypothetical protein
MINASTVNPYYFYPDQYKEMGESFFESYELEKEIYCPAQKMVGLKSKNERQCRFCGKKSPSVSFHKIAHIIPELLGNRHLVSDYECDQCNEKFGKYENDFANYLGIARTMQSVKGKKQPKFKPNEHISMATVNDPFDGEIIEIKRTDPTNDVFEFNKETNQTIIHFKLLPYTPLKIYKCLLKIALTVVDERDSRNYKFAFDVINSTTYDADSKGFHYITKYSMPYTFQYALPTIMLFRKKNPMDALITHVFVLNALNMIFHIPIPLHAQDKRHYDSGGVTQKLCPPIFGTDSIEGLEPIQQHTGDYKSNIRVKDQMSKLVLPSNEGDFEISKIVDKKTGEIKEERVFDGRKIIGINLQRREI